MPFAVSVRMSKRINVNPNFYETGGREHADEHGATPKNIKTPSKKK